MRWRDAGGWGRFHNRFSVSVCIISWFLPCFLLLFLHCCLPLTGFPMLHFSLWTLLWSGLTTSCSPYGVSLSLAWHVGPLWCMAAYLWCDRWDTGTLQFWNARESMRLFTTDHVKEGFSYWHSSLERSWPSLVGWRLSKWHAMHHLLLCDLHLFWWLVFFYPNAYWF